MRFYASIVIPSAASAAQSRATRTPQPKVCHEFPDAVRTLQEWEHGRKVPSGGAQSLLKLVSRHPELLAELA